MLNIRPRELANINQYQVILENIEQFHMTSEVDGWYERQAHMTKLSQECHFQKVGFVYCYFHNTADMIWFALVAKPYQIFWVKYVFSEGRLLNQPAASTEVLMIFKFSTASIPGENKNTSTPAWLKAWGTYRNIFPKCSPIVSIHTPLLLLLPVAVSLVWPDNF